MQQPHLTRGVHHVGLTVPDLASARRFFVEALGYEQRGEAADYPAVFVSDGTTLITLWPPTMRPGARWREWSPTPPRSTWRIRSLP